MHEVIGLPSASVLLALREKPEQLTSTSIAVFADPVFDVLDPRVDPRVKVPSSRAAQLTRTTASGEFSRLPFSQQEAYEIQRLMPRGGGLVALGFDATKKTLTAPSISNYRYLHFATHAIIDENRPKLSGIILSQVDRMGHPIDGLLSLRDIYGLKLNADLVVLSACETGGGKQIPGEGTMGLSRAFLAAGARSVIVSLWPIDDDATASLMGMFYTNLLGPSICRRRQLCAQLSNQPGVVRDGVIHTTGQDFLW